MSGVWLGLDLRTIVGSIINIILRELYPHLRRKRIFTVTMSKIFIRAPHILRKMANQHSWTNSVSHILGEVGYLKESKRGAI